MDSIISMATIEIAWARQIESNLTAGNSLTTSLDDFCGFSTEDVDKASGKLVLMQSVIHKPTNLSN